MKFNIAMDQDLKEMVLQELSAKDEAFEEIRYLWKDDIDTTGVQTIKDLFERFEKEKKRLLSEEDLEELLKDLGYVDIEKNVFSINVPRRLHNGFTTVDIGITTSASLDSALDGATTTDNQGNFSVPGYTWQEAAKKYPKTPSETGSHNIPIVQLETEFLCNNDVPTSGPANLEINSSSAPTLGDELNLVVTGQRAVKAPVINQCTEPQWQTSTRYVPEVQKITEENEVLKTQLRIQEESSEKKEALIEQLKSQNNFQELKLKEKDEKILQLERTCLEYGKVIQKVETAKKRQRRVFDERVQEIERVTKVQCDEIINLNQNLSEAGSRCYRTEEELCHKDNIIKQLGAECQQLCENRKQDHEKFKQQIQQKIVECQAESESLLQQLDNFHQTQRRAREAMLCNQSHERERQLVERLQQIERVAQGNCALHRQPEKRSWSVPRHEVTVYREQKPLGTSSWATVYRGWFGGGPVAVKELHSAIVSPHNRRLFYREMEMFSRARHQNVVQFMAGVIDDESPLIVTEVANGGSLAMILENRALQPPEINSFASDVAQGILFLHRQPVPIIHGDIKPGNVVIFEIGRPPGILAKLCDMGSANFLSRVMSPNQGTPAYSAPETQTQQYTTKVDIYSFGLVVMQMNIRELPVPGEIQRQVEQVTNTFLHYLIRRCTATNPDDRPDMERVVHELKQ